MPDESTPYYAEPKKPRLIWNKRDKRKPAEPLPAQVVEIIHPFYARTQTALDLTHNETPENRLIWTNDNLVALTSLLHGDAQHPPLEGKVDLIYIDPPFAVQSDFKINVEIENGLADEKLPTLIEELAYTDTWKDGLDSYLSMMRDRLELLKRLLAPTGSIYVHCDWHAGHYLKVILDELFGYENFRNEVVWQKTRVTKAQSISFGNVHDVVYAYGTGSDTTFNSQYSFHSEEYTKSHYNLTEENTGRRYGLWDFTQAGAGPARRFGNDDIKPPSGKHWIWSQERIDMGMKEKRIVFTSSGMPRLKRYLDDSKGNAIDDLWIDVLDVNSQAIERTSFPTQKPVALLQRIIAASSNPGDIVLDCFCGSGTTAVAAETMKDSDGKPAPSRWIAIDCGKFAVHITRKRLIEASARPFAVENIGFYARAGEWKDVWQASPSAQRYREAMVEVYGGATVEGYSFLHGKKGARWIHVGPLHAPVADAQAESILKEAATTDLKSVDILTADIQINWNKSELEDRYGVTLHAKIIPQAAIEAIRNRIARKRQKDPNLEAAPDIHFFSPPDVEVRAETDKSGGVTIRLVRLTLDLDECLATQDAAKRNEIKTRLTDWKALIDYWAVDWDYNGDWFRNDWQSFRTRKEKTIATQAAHDYPGETGDKRIAVKVTDIFGNDGLKVIRITL